MKHVTRFAFISLVVLTASCSQSVTTSSRKPEQLETPSLNVNPPARSEAPAPGDETPPPDFVPYDKEPQVIKVAHPIYPEEARPSGLQGKVWVKIWVDKTGKPRQAVIQKSSSPIFDQAAIDAAKQMVFSPAVMKGAPTDVWVMIPFDFWLK